MKTDTAIRRAQIYQFLADVFLYPDEDWTTDLPALDAALHDIGIDRSRENTPPVGRDALQAAHRHTFGMVGSLCYETEYGLPHEFRQSQELADIAGFYRAFGFTVGGQVRERPDHLSVELEFMSILALKEAYAAERGIAEHSEVCIDAQRSFLQDHLGCWINLFVERIGQTASEGPYHTIAGIAADMINADIARLGAHPQRRNLAEVRPTPLGPDLSCAECAIAELE